MSDVVERDPCPGPGWVEHPNDPRAWLYTGHPAVHPEQELSGETQGSIGRWARAKFPGGGDLSPVHVFRLLDEVIELCRAAGASWQEIERVVGLKTNLDSEREYIQHNPDPAAVPVELADVQICLMALAERRGVDLVRVAGREVGVKMAVNRDREWVSRGDGTGHHRRKEEA